jgi:hypothetical protein
MFGSLSFALLFQWQSLYSIEDFHSGVKQWMSQAVILTGAHPQMANLPDIGVARKI